MKISYFLNPFKRSATLALVTLTLSFAGGGLPILAQEKLTISVPEFKNQSSWWWWQRGTSRELADALSNELSSTGNFTVVERQKLDQVLSEQELAELGLVRPETAPESGNLTGAKYVILGQVTSYEEGVSRESSGGRVGGFNIGPINLGSTSSRSSSQEAYVAIDLRVVDTSTAEVVYSRTVEGRAIGQSQSVSSGFSILGLGMSGNQQSSNRPPVGKALRAALIEITDYLNCVMVVQGSCLGEFEAKEERRRDNTRGVLELD
ncbi:MAG: CsgG/HfaB family protein [Crocosphaera sp.]